MIFARRALQKRLDDLRKIIGHEKARILARRLNQRNRHGLAAAWEVAILHSLSRLAVIEYEVPLPSGRCPDVYLRAERLDFTVEITTVSDDGLDKNNPYDELFKILTSTMKKLGLGPGGLDLRVNRMPAHISTATKLHLPDRKQLVDFVKRRVIPELRRQIRLEASVLFVPIDDAEASLEIYISRRQTQFNHGSYPAYNMPASVTNNPLFKALKAKADQLRGAEGIKGIIVADCGCAALKWDETGSRDIHSKQIGNELLRQCTSVDFVLLLGLHEGFSPAYPKVSTLRIEAMHCANRLRPQSRELRDFLEQMVRGLPKPIETPVNALSMLNSRVYDRGFKGGFEMSSDRISISSRELMELLAGIPDRERTGRHAYFAQKLTDGLLPRSISIIDGGDDAPDDWVQFDFDESDPAISPFR